MEHCYYMNTWNTKLFVTLCLQELDVIEPEGNVYKLIGPVLVKQDLEEAKQTVRKRIEYITAEM